MFWTAVYLTRLLYCTSLYFCYKCHCQRILTISQHFGRVTGNSIVAAFYTHSGWDLGFLYHPAHLYTRILVYELLFSGGRSVYTRVYVYDSDTVHGEGDDGAGEIDGHRQQRLRQHHRNEEAWDRQAVPGADAEESVPAGRRRHLLTGGDRRRRCQADWGRQLVHYFPVLHCKNIRISTDILWRVFL